MKHKKQTLVILSPGFPKDKADTSCLPPQQIFVKALKEVCPGLNVVVLTFQYPFFAAEYEWHGVKVISVGGKDKGRIFRLVTWLKAWLILKRLRKEYQVIGLLSFWLGECAFVGSRFAKKHKLPHYTWMLGQDAKKWNKYFRWIKPGGDELIALSDFIVKEVKRNYKITPMQVIPVGIDTSLFSAGHHRRDIDILGAGALIPLKQYDVFIESVGYLREFYPHIKAVICGKGPDMEGLQSLARTKNLSDNITFKGELPHKEVLRLMQRSKIFLHPSNYEGFGAVLSEALYSGAQVVSFCKPMDKSYRHHQVVNTAEEMNAKLLSILKDKKTDHEPVLMCTIQQIAKNMISLFVD
jgi:glycosyltransferase involved in cell wall biosynthesis